MSIDTSFAFHLDAGKPAACGEFDPTDETLGEMVQSVFPLDTDVAVLDWAGIRLGLNYKYDISMMLDDVLTLIRELNSAPSGKKVIAWVSSGFPYRWEVEWNLPSLDIRAFPHAASNTTLRTRESIHDSISHFVAEWIPILDAVRSAAIHARYDISKLPNGDILLSLGPARR